MVSNPVELCSLLRCQLTSSWFRPLTSVPLLLHLIFIPIILPPFDQIIARIINHSKAMPSHPALSLLRHQQDGSMEHYRIRIDHRLTRYKAFDLIEICKEMAFFAGFVDLSLTRDGL